MYLVLSVCDTVVLPLLLHDMLPMKGLLCLSSIRLTGGDQDDDRCQQTILYYCTASTGKQTADTLDPTCHRARLTAQGSPLKKADTPGCLCRLAFYKDNQNVSHGDYKV